MRNGIGSATQRQRIAVHSAQPASHLVEHRHLVVGEIAAGTIEHDAGEGLAIDIQRDGKRVVDADAAVILIVQRCAKEFGAADGIGNPVRSPVVMRAVETDERKCLEMSVEGRDIGREKRASSGAHDTPATGGEITHGQRGQFRVRQMRQLRDADPRKQFRIGTCCANRAEDGNGVPSRSLPASAHLGSPGEFHTGRRCRHIRGIAYFPDA